MHINQTNWSTVGKCLSDLYEIVDCLEKYFPGRKFTPDGHLVGSIGEVIAAYMFNLELLPNSYPNHDAVTKAGVLVQIKFTQDNKRVALRDEPNHLLVLRLTSERSIEVVYNGTGRKPWEKAGKVQKNGQRQISISRLRNLNEEVSNLDSIIQQRSISFSDFATPPT